jgi:excisionase family DNA binding protein
MLLPTFEQLPHAVALLGNKLDNIEKLLLTRQPEESADADTLITIQQAAELIALSVPTIYGLVSRREIPVSKKGKRLYFSKQELLDWIKSGRKKTNAEISAEATGHVSKNKRG